MDLLPGAAVKFGSELQGQRRLEPGDLVEFSIGANERGPAAVAVQVLERAGDL